MKTYKIAWGSHSLELGERTCIMGIVNVTPDSFSDGGKFFSFEAAVAQGRKLAADGADILDIGGESSRPFSEPVSVEEELRRVLPVIETLAKSVSIPISIDTTRAVVARKSLEAGASIINDISALRLDGNLSAVAAEYGVPIVLMHMLGTPKTMQVSPVYGNVIADVKFFLEDAINRAEKAGIERGKVIIDPGIGFGKTVEHNLSLIQHLHELTLLGVPVLIGPSRKAFIRNILKDPASKDIQPDLPVVEIGTQAAIAASVLNGAHIVRAHNVANTSATVKIIDAIKNSTKFS
ncbi:MAG: dihydropteroate synthase [Pseudomonadota bacterium]